MSYFLSESFHSTLWDACSCGFVYSHCCVVFGSMTIGHNQIPWGLFIHSVTDEFVSFSGVFHYQKCCSERSYVILHDSTYTFSWIYAWEQDCCVIEYTSLNFFFECAYFLADIINSFPLWLYTPAYESFSCSAFLPFLPPSLSPSLPLSFLFSFPFCSSAIEITIS